MSKLNVSKDVREFCADMFFTARSQAFNSLSLSLSLSVQKLKSCVTKTFTQAMSQTAFKRKIVSTGV